MFSSTCSISVTGASFVIFDGALKSGGDEFSVTVVEDGVQIRLQTDTMEELVKNLGAGEDFNLRSPSMHLNVAWRTPRPPQHLQGALVSPVDGQVLAVSAATCLVHTNFSLYPS